MAFGLLNLSLICLLYVDPTASADPSDQPFHQEGLHLRVDQTDRLDWRGQ